MYVRTRARISNFYLPIDPTDTILCSLTTKGNKSLPSRKSHFPLQHFGFSRPLSRSIFVVHTYARTYTARRTLKFATEFRSVSHEGNIKSYIYIYIPVPSRWRQIARCTPAKCNNSLILCLVTPATISGALPLSDSPLILTNGQFIFQTLPSR